ncbi:hypothetical protein FGB62_133g011 [Gracilaria domingensis]|nr:hypothetical protein FGB62_564g07 [Gracilaria domingensis]KAI0559867.1 hypothetical protein FGB62_133g011 [Gracilaria domingensis]
MKCVPSVCTWGRMANEGRASRRKRSAREAAEGEGEVAEERRGGPAIEWNSGELRAGGGVKRWKAPPKKLGARRVVRRRARELTLANGGAAGRERVERGAKALERSAARHGTQRCDFDSGARISREAARCGRLPATRPSCAACARAAARAQWPLRGSAALALQGARSRAVRAAQVPRATQRGASRSCFGARVAALCDELRRRRRVRGGLLVSAAA